MNYLTSQRGRMVQYAICHLELSISLAYLVDEANVFLRDWGEGMLAGRRAALLASREMREVVLLFESVGEKSCS